jgi:MFS family permease
MPAALAPLLLTLLLWLATRLWHKRSLANLSLFAIAVLIASLSGPVGWGALLVTFAAALVVALGRGEKMTPRQVTAWLGLVVIAVLPAVIVASRHKASGRSLIIGTNFAHYLGGVWTTLLAFQIHGDDNYFHNLGGAPLLNVFVGIMLVAGILVSLTRWKKRPERALLVGTVVALIPALMSPQTAPDASRLVLVLPLVLVLAAIGVGYMLEVWYATFPINSAARLTGQLAIILLLALTAYQGYTQYFVAWANSSDTHRAYNDAALGMASWIAHEPAGTTSLVVVNTDDATVLRYKLVTQPSYRVVTPAQLNASLTQRPLYLVVGTADRDQVVAQLKTAAPGGTLQSHQSSFDGADLYYTYDIR